MFFLLSEIEFLNVTNPNQPGVPPWQIIAAFLVACVLKGIFGSND